MERGECNCLVVCLSQKRDQKMEKWSVEGMQLLSCMFVPKAGSEDGKMERGRDAHLVVVRPTSVAIRVMFAQQVLSLIGLAPLNIAATGPGKTLKVKKMEVVGLAKAATESCGSKVCVCLYERGGRGQ